MGEWEEDKLADFDPKNMKSVKEAAKTMIKDKYCGMDGTCNNKGTCEASGDKYMCKCNEGFDGKTCEFSAALFTSYKSLSMAIFSKISTLLPSSTNN